MRGAGGTEGGIGRFLIGLGMVVVGGYLFFDSIRVTSGFHWGGSIYDVGGMSVTSGMILIPLIAGIAVIFYDASNLVGWVLAGGSLLALAFGVIRNIQFVFQSMSLLSLLIILVLLFGGIGLLLSGLRDQGAA
jgi:hypothetical protein